MKTMFILLGLLFSLSAPANYASAGRNFQTAEKAIGCGAYGKTYSVGEQDCDGRTCQRDGTWRGVVRSGTCDVSDDQTADQKGDREGDHEQQEELDPDSN